MKPKLLLNHSIQEGIFFLILGGALFWHGMDSHGKGFNQDWSQSPYLFPVLVAVLMAILAVTLMYQGINVQSTTEAVREKTDEKKHTIPVFIILGITLAYYLALVFLQIPYITFGILSYSLTISNFEIVTVLFLLAMMLYLGVRKIPVLLFVPVGTSLFLSVAFRAMLHVLLP